MSVAGALRGLQSDDSAFPDLRDFKAFPFRDMSTRLTHVVLKGRGGSVKKGKRVLTVCALSVDGLKRLAPSATHHVVVSCDVCESALSALFDLCERRFG